MVIQPQSQVPIQTDASKKGWRAVCRGIRTRGQWSKKEQDLHINQMELLSIIFAIFTFVKMSIMSAIHIQVDNMKALSYLQKMGETKNRELMQISKEIWEFILGHGITHYMKSVQMQSYFWSVFSCIRIEFGDLLCKSPYSIRIHENTGQK